MDSSAATADLKLHGVWASSYVHRVKLALKLKGLDFDYVEEDLSNKSADLLLYNPVHKKVPVLVHRGRPLAESVVILEYIDETWADRCPLLPEDPYERAVIRFWIHFFENQMAASSLAALKKTGEEQKAAIERFVADTEVIEKELREGFFRGRKFFGGEHMCLLDVVFVCGSQWFPMLEECTGIDLLDGERFPRLSSVIANFDEHPAVKEVFAEKEKLAAFLKALRVKWTEEAVAAAPK